MYLKVSFNFFASCFQLIFLFINLNTCAFFFLAKGVLFFGGWGCEFYGYCLYKLSMCCSSRLSLSPLCSSEYALICVLCGVGLYVKVSLSFPLV